MRADPPAALFRAAAGAFVAIAFTVRSRSYWMTCSGRHHATLQLLPELARDARHATCSLSWRSIAPTASLAGIPSSARCAKRCDGRGS